MPTITGNPATEKQRAFALKLEAERVVPVGGKSPEEAGLIARLEDLHEIGEDRRFVSTREASAVIDWLMNLPRTPVIEADGFDPQTNEIGVYIMPDGTVVKVQPNKDKTRIYAKRWVVIGGQRLVDATEERVHGEWEYAPGLLRSIRPELRMNLEQAKEFILRYGQCARCGRRLKAAQSVERGIGPVCIQYFSF